MAIRKAYSADVEQIGERTIRVIASTDSVDMMGDIVVQEGGDLSVYKRNPIVLFSHSPEMPIGTTRAIGLVDGKLTAEIEFAPAGISHKADEICALTKAGILKSVSIGFDPVEAEPLNPSRPRGPQKYLKWILCEISVVAIPANTEAIVTEKAMSTPTTKAANPLKFKGLYDIGCLAELMCRLNYIHDNSVWEKACEGDDSAVPAKLASLLHGVGEALVAMTQEEVAECLACVDGKMEGCDDEDDITVIELSNNPSVQKFRKGVRAVKSGRAVSQATAGTIQDAMDTHAMVHSAQAVHTKCMKALQNVIPPENEESKAKTPGQTKAAAAPGVVSGDAAPVLRDAMDSHDALAGAMKVHAKCMKSLGSLAPPVGVNAEPPQTSEPGGDDTSKPTEKGIDIPLTKEQRMKRARLLAIPPAG